jgi:capsular polysaccharide biosynthesis protein
LDEAAIRENKKWIRILAIGFVSLLLCCGFLLINNSYYNNCQCKVQLDMINERMQAHNLQVDNAIHLLEYQILQTKEMMNINIKNLEIGMDLLPVSKTKYTIKYKANL